MDQKGQQDQGGEQISQGLLAVSKVVVEMIALGFERVVILVLDFPSRPPGTGQRRDVALGDAMGGGPGILKDDAVIGIGGDKFKPCLSG